MASIRLQQDYMEGTRDMAYIVPQTSKVVFYTWHRTVVRDLTL